MLKERWESAMTMVGFIERAEVNQDLWRSMRKRARVPTDVAKRLQGLPEARHLLVLLEDWCGDAVTTTPVVAKLAEETPNLELRVLRRDDNLDLMDAHLRGTERAIPVVIVLDEQLEELAWWGSPPAELQRWVSSPEAQRLMKEDRYREVRRWYARDHGRTTREGITDLLEMTAAAEAA